MRCVSWRPGVSRRLRFTQLLIRHDPGCSNDVLVHDPYALRSTMLIAGLHYLWKTGHLQSYERTFLFHKGETIRTIKEWIVKQDAANAAVAVRQAVILGFSDVCTCAHMLV